MNTREAARQLGLDQKTVRRYIAKGLLPARREGHSFKVAIVDIQNLSIRLGARKKLDGKIKELFVLREYGTPFAHIQEEYGFSPDDVDNSVFVYNHERGRYLSKFGIEDPSDFLLVEEISARLKVVDRHIPYVLRDLGELEMHAINWKGKDRFFPSKRSFGEYLGAAVQIIFYNSREVADQIMMDVKTIDRIACSNGIGRKIKSGSNHSNYLFTPEEVDKIRHGKRSR